MGKEVNKNAINMSGPLDMFLDGKQDIDESGVD
jgi:hypothetical protein